MRSKTERIYFIAEKVVVVGALLYFMGAIFPVLRNPGDNNMVSDMPSLLLQMAVYALLLPFILRARGTVLNGILKNPVLMSLVLMALVSFVWSGDPTFSLRRALVFVATTVVGLYFGTRFDMREQLRLVTAALAICVFLSVFFIVAMPTYGFDIGVNAEGWRGVFLQKNYFATYMVFAVISFICFRAESFAETIIKYLGLAISVVLVAGSLSKGSYVVLAVSLLLVVLYRLLHLYWKRLIPAAAVAFTLVAIGAIYVSSNFDAFLRLLGKNANLNGRIPLWTAVLSVSTNNRWFGYGFAGFWITNEHSIWSMIGWAPLKAHNGFIDILLELGLVGLGLFAINTVIALSRSVKLVLRERTTESQWPLLMLSVILLYNIFESDLMVQNIFMWVAYAAITVSTQRAWSLSRAAERTERPDSPAEFSTPGYEPCPQ
jgi:exopolysaccharide production protein ExoQ